MTHNLKTLAGYHRLSLRKRLGLGVAILVLPLLLITFSGYLLFQYALEKMDEMYTEVSEEFIPVTTLQESVLRAVMPANDYLIHGNTDERLRFKLLRSEVDEGFARAMAVQFDEPRKHANVMRAHTIWQEATHLSEELLAMEKPMGSVAGAALMEKMDSLVDEVYDQLEYACSSTVSDLHSQHDLLHQTRLKIGVVIVVFVIMVSIVVLVGSLLIRRWIIAPLAELEAGAQELANGQLDYRIPVDSNDEIGKVARTFNEMAAALKHDRDMLRDLTIHDSLTSLLNRKEFERLMDLEMTRALRHGHEIALLMIDIDHFKNVNDQYGHQAGDEVLKSVADRIRASLRPSDMMARYGGEEFIVMLPETDRKGADAFGERLCAYVRSTPVDISPTIQPVITVSGGIAMFPADADTKPALIEAADKTLYAAKSAGRNRCCRYAEPC